MSRLLAASSMALAFLFAVLPAQSQQVPAQTGLTEEALPTETLQIGLSTDTVGIGSDFSGQNLTIFGALTNLDTQIQRQGRYDIVVVLQGPESPIVVHRKTRVMGMWMNTTSQQFEQVPESYIATATRQLQDVTDRKTFEQLSLGVSGLAFDASRFRQSYTEEFVAAVKDINKANGRYSDGSGVVEFISPNLFRATLELPANVPVGKHRARAFLFKNGTFIKESSTDLQIRKAGIEQQLFNFAQERSALYGLLSVLAAIAIGWLGKLIFSRE